MHFWFVERNQLDLGDDLSCQGWASRGIFDEQSARDPDSSSSYVICVDPLRPW
jgi:hypothetical protein